MNSNTAEERIRTKVEQMDTLQAGIVYGKEDAWDRLQARLDAKPARKSLPWYKITAAAAALLLIAGTACYFTMNGDNQPLHGMRCAYKGALSNAENVTLPKTPETFITVPAIQDTYTSISVHTGPKHPLIHKQPQVIKEEPSPVVLEEEHAPEPTPTQLAPAPKMKVVHINDLGQQEDSTAHYAWEERNPFPHIQFHMKVIHINDIGQPIRQEDYMRNAEKAAVWRLPFGHSNPYSAGQQPGRLFRINLSTNRNNEKTTFYTGAGMGVDSTEPVVY